MGKMKEKTREGTVCSVKPMGSSPEMLYLYSDPSSCCLRAMFLMLKLHSRCKNQNGNPGTRGRSRKEIDTFLTAVVYKFPSDSPRPWNSTFRKGACATPLLNSHPQVVILLCSLSSSLELPQICFKDMKKACRPGEPHSDSVSCC